MKKSLNWNRRWQGHLTYKRHKALFSDSEIENNLLHPLPIPLLGLQENQAVLSEVLLQEANQEEILEENPL